MAKIGEIRKSIRKDWKGAPVYELHGKEDKTAEEISRMTQQLKSWEEARHEEARRLLEAAEERADERQEALEEAFGEMFQRSLERQRELIEMAPIIQAKKMVERAEELAKIGDFKTAISLCRKALASDKDPANIDAYLVLAVAYESQDKIKKAKETIGEAIRLLLISDYKTNILAHIKILDSIVESGYLELLSDFQAVLRQNLPDLSQSYDVEEEYNAVIELVRRLTSLFMFDSSLAVAEAFADKESCRPPFNLLYLEEEKESIKNALAFLARSKYGQELSPYLEISRVIIKNNYEDLVPGFVKVLERNCQKIWYHKEGSYLVVKELIGWLNKLSLRDCALELAKVFAEKTNLTQAHNFLHAKAYLIDINKRMGKDCGKLGFANRFSYYSEQLARELRVALETVKSESSLLPETKEFVSNELRTVFKKWEPEKKEKEQAERKVDYERAKSEAKDRAWPGFVAFVISFVFYWVVLALFPTPTTAIILFGLCGVVFFVARWLIRQSLANSIVNKMKKNL